MIANMCCSRCLAFQSTATQEDVSIRTKRRKRQSSSNNRRSSKPRQQRTPVVDSDLLRFVSSQKRARLQQQKLSSLVQTDPEDADLTNPLPSLGTTPAKNTGGVVDFSGFAAYVTSLFSPLTETRTDSDASEVPPVATTDRNFIEDTTADDPYAGWLRQYNHNRVSSLLVSRLEKSTEADQNLRVSIALAGERVQAQALARIARQRVREFLKKRDQAWLSPRDERVESATAQEVIPVSQFRNNTDNLEQVVDILMENGLVVKDIAEILIHSPGIALMQPRVDPAQGNQNGETVEETMDRVWTELLGSTLSLRKTDARMILRVTPGLLTMRGSKSATDMVSLLTQLQVSTKSIARSKRELPALLSRSPAAVFRLVAFLSSDAVRMPVSQIGPLLRRSNCQELLNAVAPVQRLEEAARVRRQIAGFTNITSIDALPKTDYDLVDTDLLFDDEDDAMATDPSVLSAIYGRGSQLRREQVNALYRNMSETAWTLRHEIGTEDLGKVIAAYPSVLLLNAKEQIMPSANYLMQKLGIWEDDLPRVLQLYPVLLGKPVHEMELVEEYLLSLDIPVDQLPGIIRSFPSLLTLDVETQMKPVVSFLSDQVGVSNIGRFVSRLPAVLGYSIENDLKPKWDFLSSILPDACFAVSRFPAYFSYPLDRVVRTRFAYLERVKGIPPTLMARLDNVVRYGDVDFAVKVARDRDGGEAFGNFAAEFNNKQRRKPRRRRPE